MIKALKRNQIHIIIALIFSSIISLALFSCGPSREEMEYMEKMKGQERAGYKNIGNGYVIIIIDGCEYIEYDHIGGSGIHAHTLTHKGNCKNTH